MQNEYSKQRFILLKVVNMYFCVKYSACKLHFCALLCYNMACLAFTYVLQLLVFHKVKVFVENILYIKIWAMNFSRKFIWKLSYSRKNFAISHQKLRDILSKTSRYLIKIFAISYQKLRDILSKTYLGLHAMCLICFTILIKRLEFCWKILCETSVKIFKKIHPEGGGLCHVDTWTLQRQIRDGTKNRLSKLFERA